VPYSIVRQPVGGRVSRPTDQNSAPYHLVRGYGVLFFAISLSPRACPGGERWQRRGIPQAADSSATSRPEEPQRSPSADGHLCATLRLSLTLRLRSASLSNVEGRAVSRVEPARATLSPRERAAGDVCLQPSPLSPSPVWRGRGNKKGAGAILPRAPDPEHRDRSRSKASGQVPIKSIGTGPDRKHRDRCRPGPDYSAPDGAHHHAPQEL
jgi:hypothetical protein